MQLRPVDALNYIEKYGISDCKYTYNNSEGVCKRSKFKRAVNAKVIKVVDEPLNGDEELLMRIVAAKGSVVVIMHIAESIFTYASGGLSFNHDYKLFLNFRF